MAWTRFDLPGGIGDVDNRLIRLFLRLLMFHLHPEIIERIKLNLHLNLEIDFY
ncbi:MAG: hypothetical protein KKC19_02425 [Nanoarchaeota archaeon]|nr:hypothetical protein [Nanoarchaeota archaeon]